MGNPILILHFQEIFLWNYTLVKLHMRLPLSQFEKSHRQDQIFLNFTNSLLRNTRRKPISIALKFYNMVYGMW